MTTPNPTTENPNTTPSVLTGSTPKPNAPPGPSTVAKGCVSCHAKLEDDQNARFRFADFGPPLQGRTFPVDYLTMKIKNPAEGRSAPVGGIVMPQLELDAFEVEDLVRFLSPSVVTAEGG